ncbi:hypothetical protein DFH08DRAFT_802234 [Mycena albidolilacea]|uniref:Uncharacterized protein n=1 Tax=Mycena albidolilacea TaxID=1033008 RepID=A0AAD7AH48_9AGAR|nr:hypothetical protein DFH08DRAFT_802234 [Mycena albidolilacea]
MSSPKTLAKFKGTHQEQKLPKSCPGLPSESKPDLANPCNGGVATRSASKHSTPSSTELESADYPDAVIAWPHLALILLAARSGFQNQLLYTPTDFLWIIVEVGFEDTRAARRWAHERFNSDRISSPGVTCEAKPGQVGFGSAKEKKGKSGKGKNNAHGHTARRKGTDRQHSHPRTGGSRLSDSFMRPAGDIWFSITPLVKLTYGTPLAKRPPHAFHSQFNRQSSLLLGVTLDSSIGIVAKIDGAICRSVTLLST